MTEDAIYRALTDLKELLLARLDAVHERLGLIDRVQRRVEGIDSRLTALEAFKSSHERRIRDLEGAGAGANHEYRLKQLEHGRDEDSQHGFSWRLGLAVGLVGAVASGVVWSIAELILKNVH